jgi:hypothetical protein
MSKMIENTSRNFEEYFLASTTIPTIPTIINGGEGGEGEDPKKIISSSVVGVCSSEEEEKEEGRGDSEKNPESILPTPPQIFSSINFDSFQRIEIISSPVDIMTTLAPIKLPQRTVKGSREELTKDDFLSGIPRNFGFVGFENDFSQNACWINTAI